jgi:catechol 2,3-dioxygenase-like lactoylglutathione lyase family enzyme
MPSFPVLMHTALDATDCRELAEFYRAFLGLRYRPGDEPPGDEPPGGELPADGSVDDGSVDDADWLVLVDEAGRRVLAFNQVESLARPTWPTDEVPKQMHHDFRVSSVAELEQQRRRAEALGATVLYDRSGDEGEPLYVLADPAGHPFCVLVSAG